MLRRRIVPWDKKEKKEEESYRVNGSFHTRIQETTGLCTSCLNGVVGLSRASLKEGLHQYLKGVIQLLADDSQVSVSMFYISCLWSATLLLHHWLFLLCFSFKGFVLLLIHASQTQFSITN